MKIKKFWKFTFVCESKSNRSGFKHECTMFDENNRELGFSKIQYYNRTRERFAFEKVIDDCIRDFRKRKIEDKIYYYRLDNDIKRLSSEKKKQLITEFDYSELWQAIQNARDEIACYNGF